MAELDIIVRLIDQASDEVQAIVDSVQGLTERMGEVGETASQSLQTLENAGSAGAESMESISAAAESAKKGLDDASLSAENLGSEVKAAGSSSSELESLGEAAQGVAEGLAGLGLTASLGKALDMAGRFQDSWTRLGLAFRGTGVTMKALKGLVNSLSEETGRSGGVIRETLLRLGVAGVTSASALKSAFHAISAAAFVTGKNIDTVSSAYTRMVQSGQFQARSLVMLGISTGDVLRATGMTIDEVRAKFETLDEEGRAALLNQILLSKYGAAANEAYKSSWEGLMEAIRIAGDRLSRLFGAMVLPVAIPALKAFTGLVSALGDAVDSLPGPLKTVIGAVLGLTAGTLLLSGTVKTLSAALSWLVPGFLKEALAGEASLAAKVKNALANQALIVSTYGSAAAMETAVGAAMAHAGAVSVSTGAQNMGILASMRYTASLMWQRIVTAASTVYTYGLAAAQWALNAALMASPITWIVVAVMAFVVALYILYQRVEWVRDGVNWLWDSLKGFATTLGGQVMAALRGLWGVLSSVGGAIYSGLAGALQWLAGVLAPVGSAISGFIGWLGGLVYSFYTTTDGVRALVAALGPLGISIGFLLNPFQTLRLIIEELRKAWDQWLQSAEGKATIAQLREAFNELRFALNEVWAALQPVFQVLGEVWAEMMRAVAPTRAMGGAVKDAGSSAGGSSGPLQVFVDIIRGVGWALQVVVIPAIRIFAAVIRGLAPVIQAVAVAVGLLIQAFRLVWTVVGPVIDFLRQLNLAFLRLVTGNMTLTQFLGEVWGAFRATIGAVLMQILLAVGRFTVQLIARAIQGGIGFVRGFLSFILSLPGRLWVLLLVAVSHVVAWTNQMRARAMQTGRNVLNGVLQYVKQLPGKVWEELMRTIDRIKQAPGKAWDAAVQFGKSIWNGVKRGLGIASPGYIYRDVKEELDRVKKELDSRREEMGGAARKMANDIGSSFKVTATPPSATPTATPTVTGNPLENVAKGAAESMKTLTTTTTNTIQGMQGTFHSGLGNIVATNAKSMKEVADTTRRGLDQVRKSTVTEVGNVRKSWKGMQDALTGSAVTIKNKVTSEVTKLSVNMGLFWRRVQNPASLIGAGPGPAGAPIMNIRAPGGAYAGPDPLQLGDYFDEDILPFCEDEPCYAGAWNYAPPWTSKLLSTIYGWDLNLWGYQMPVGSFRNTSTPRIPVGAFAHMIQRIIGRTRYAFYYNSRYPSPAAALRAGAFNCYDGALIVLALARAFGLSGSMRHGYWGRYRHVWANVEGVDIDTTAIQHGYGLTSPKVHAGPGPLPVAPGGDVRVSLDHNVNLTVTVRGEGVKDSEVIRAVREARLDEELKRALLEDEGFRGRLLKEVGSAISREERYYGV